MLEMHPKRRCSCSEHIGDENWHGKFAGTTGHRCSCDACRRFWSGYNSGLYQTKAMAKENIAKNSIDKNSVMGLIGPRRRCGCFVHSGEERWHRNTSGYFYHRCRCTICIKVGQDYLAGRKPEPILRVCALANCNHTFAHNGRGGAKYCSDECKRTAVEARYQARLDAGWKPKPWSEKWLPKRRKALWEKQNGLCALCKKPVELEKSCLDHDHSCCPCKTRESCGKCDRGVLHNSCNAMIGFANDNTDLLLMGVDYILGFGSVLEVTDDAQTVSKTS
jgi:hypothetical protein